MRARSAGEGARVFGDRASGLREDRPAYRGLLAAVAGGPVTVVRVTLPPPGDQGGGASFVASPKVSYPWARFELNIEPLEEVLGSMGLHAKQSGGREELLDDFSWLAAAFAGRRSGMRPAEARSRLLAGPGRCPGGGGR